MAFVGLVTQKEKDSGCILRARIVSPSGKSYGQKDFPVLVKKRAKSAFELCRIACENSKNLIEKNNISELTEDMAFPDKGFDTNLDSYPEIAEVKLKYTIIDLEGQAPLSDYLNPEGKIISRPKYGISGTSDENVSGKVEINASYGDEYVKKTLDVTIKSATAEEVLNLATPINAEALWSRIYKVNGRTGISTVNAGFNKATYGTSKEFGNMQIHAPLNLISEVYGEDIKAISAKPVQVTWEIKDDMQSEIKNINKFYTRDYTKEVSTFGVESRIALETNTSKNIRSGDVFTPDYSKACKLLDTYKSVGTCWLLGDALIGRTIAMGGITLTATFSLEGSDLTKTIELKCATLSSDLSRTEVLDEFVKQMKIYTETPDNKYIDTQSPYDFSKSNSGVPNSITDQSSIVEYITFRMYSSYMLSKVAIPALYIDSGMLVNSGTIQNSLFELEPDSTNNDIPYESVGELNTAESANTIFVKDTYDITSSREEAFDEFHMYYSRMYAAGVDPARRKFRFGSRIQFTFPCSSKDDAATNCYCLFEAK